MNKGDRGNPIFHNGTDRKILLALLASVSEMFHVRVLAFSLMDNHYHLLLLTIEANLSRVMHYLNAVYTQKYNRKYRCGGHVFQGRYKAILIDRDSYLLEASRYIHLNPVRAGLVKAPEKHLWTSHRLYLGLAHPPAWVCVDEILSFFGKDRRSSRRAFDRFVKQGDSDHVIKIYTQKHTPAILGSNAFIERIRAVYLDEHADDYELPEAKRIGRIPLEKIVDAIASHYKVGTAELMRGRRKFRNQPRRLALYIARKHAGYPLRA
ncbi:MAG: transposase, partial [bacterium]